LWQSEKGIVTRKYNRLSVKPQLNISFNMLEGKVRVIIKNCGVGPAVIKTIQVKFQNEFFDGCKMEWGIKIGDEFAALLNNENIGDLLQSNSDVIYSVYVPGDVLSANESYNLLEFKGNVRNDKALALVYLLLFDL